ncbi:mitochondrial transcription termination factorfamily protein [Striga asiatica]|uniref:Mitochondrial transcription termination factorfamily protein n=1 Tax=Striga asiatica TaxID=4170 RepID=A0A5A7REK4_STRAF|nr:mitochondrial transcription termination factorfamily protein [Striga asiatica]
MVFLHALNRGEALFARRLQPQSSHLFTYLCMGPHQLHKIVDDIYSYSCSSYPHFQKPCLFHSAASPSVECLHEQIESPDSVKKPRDDEKRRQDPTNVFKKWGCSESDISRIFERRPSLRKTDIHVLQSKLQILSELGIESSDLVKMIHCRPRLLNSKINVMLNERVNYLESLFGSRELLAKAFVRNPSLLTYDFHNKMKPAVAMYESLGLSREDLIFMLLSRPTLIPRTTLDEEKIEYIRKTGVSKDSKMYKHVVSLLGISRIETIREKVVNLGKYGIPENKVYGLIGRSPFLLTLSVDNVQRHMTFILATMKLPATVLLQCPFLLYASLESVLRPRFRVACKIEDMGLFPEVKGPSLLRALRMSEKRFISAFITCHPESVVEELMAEYRNAKCVRRLAESSKKVSNKGFPF